MSLSETKRNNIFLDTDMFVQGTFLHISLDASVVADYRDPDYVWYLNILNTDITVTFIMPVKFFI